jgi:hypothetical protein
MFLKDRLADITDGALMRDTRMVERKKTGRAKARKGVSHWSLKSWLKLTCTVHLGQALNQLCHLVYRLRYIMHNIQISHSAE